MVKDDERKNIDVIHAVLEYYGLDFDSAVEFVKDRLGHDFRYSIDNNKITNEGTRFIVVDKFIKRMWVIMQSFCNFNCLIKLYIKKYKFC